MQILVSLLKLEKGVAQYSLASPSEKRRLLQDLQKQSVALSNESARLTQQIELSQKNKDALQEVLQEKRYDATAVVSPAWHHNRDIMEVQLQAVLCKAFGGAKSSH